MGKNNRLTRLRRALATPGQVQLGIGPMSRSCVDAVIALANEYRLPLMLIASRRQIECSAQGGGYVNGWTTETFSRYVREHDRGDHVLLCRDHGGPWQNYPEVAQHTSFTDAMASAKTSLAQDIHCGFDVLHLDPSVNLNGDLSPDDTIEALKDLYLFCEEEARRAGRDVAFEVGKEEQTGHLQSASELEDFLEILTSFCDEHALSEPIFVVAQMGTLVKETANVGDFAVAVDAPSLEVLEHRARAITAAASRYGMWIKEHNADYLPPAILRRRPHLGIGAINVGPELGVVETSFLLRVCAEFGLHAEAEAFLQLAYETGKWEKWLVSDTTATDREKSIIAGHYVFGTAEFRRIYDKMVKECNRRGFELNCRVQEHVKSAIKEALVCLGLVHL